MKNALVFSSETPLRRFVAYIDPENHFAIEDKLSQINTLEQMSNIASYGFLKSRLESHDLHIHALWFDIYTGDIYYFSRGAKQFVTIDETTVEKLSEEIRKYYSWWGQQQEKQLRVYIPQQHPAYTQYNVVTTIARMYGVHSMRL